MQVSISAGQGGIVWWLVSELGPVDTAAVEPGIGQQIEKLLESISFFGLPDFLPGQHGSWTPPHVQASDGEHGKIVAAEDLPGDSLMELEGLLRQAGAVWQQHDIRDEQ